MRVPAIGGVEVVDFFGRAGFFVGEEAWVVEEGLGGVGHEGCGWQLVLFYFYHFA